MSHREGLITIDHRGSPGISDEVALRAGYPIGYGKELLEAPTLTCGHCRTIVVIEPRRTRERAKCGHCTHYLCDRCGAAAVQNAPCKPLNKLLDELYETALKTLKE